MGLVTPSLKVFMADVVFLVAGVSLIVSGIFVTLLLVKGIYHLLKMKVD